MFERTFTNPQDFVDYLDHLSIHLGPNLDRTQDIPLPNGDWLRFYGEGFAARISPSAGMAVIVHPYLG